MNAKLKFRSRFVLFCIFLALIWLIVTLYRIQIINGSSYAERANSQYIQPRSALLDRGLIFFNSKDGTKIQAATLKNGYTVFINPSRISDPKIAFEALSQYVKIDESEFKKKATKPNDKYEEIETQVDESVAVSVRNLGIPGLGAIKETWRIYPGDIMAAHVLGILGESASSSLIVGRYGLERFYENVLQRYGSEKNLNVFAKLFGDSDNKNLEDNHSGDIYTTIEPTTQKYLEQVLSEIKGKWDPAVAGGIVIDPNTGEILAMASLPVFNPNNTSEVKDPKIFSNPLVENVYEMGSIIKPLTVAVALDYGVITPDSTYNDTGTMVLSGKKISNHDNRARGITTIQELLGRSLNVGAATIALQVGKENFSKYFLNLGFGNKTGVDLPSEAGGLIGNLKTGRDVEIATAAYGQGIAVSPIAVTRSLSALANGGYLITPHLVREIKYTDGGYKKIEIQRQGPVFKKETTDQVTKMLVEVVDKSLLNGAIKNERYSIAAKTGTAQIPDHIKGGYYTDRYLHSFFGYFPAYDPKYLIFLYQVNPKGTEYAADTLTEPFDKIVKFMINYFNIAPDR